MHARNSALETVLESRAAELERAEAQLLQSQARAAEFEKKLTSSRYLFKAAWKKILHAPRDLSRKYRRSRNLKAHDPYCLTTDDRFRRVVYVSGAPDIPSHIYRVDHHMQALHAAQIEAGWISISDVARFETSLVFAEIVVLFRVAWNTELSEVIDKCRKAGVLVLYDIDDYVFDPKIANERYVDGIRFVPPEQLSLYREGVMGYQAAMRNVDGGVFSTRILAEAMIALGKPAYVLPNGCSDRIWQRSTEILRRRQSSGDRGKVRIGYASGTLTHQKDFAVIVPALARILKDNPKACLTIVGEIKLDEFPELKPWQNRIERRRRVPHASLPFEYARFDINIAPLEVGNPFCEAKSSLKYIEAGLVGVPTVASPTQPYRSVIRNGDNGFLAATDEEWYRVISRLIQNQRLRHEVGLRARNDSDSKFGPKAKGRQVKELFGKLLDSRLKNVKASRKKLGQTVLVVLPAMSRGSGGHAKAISLAKGLAEHGHSVIVNFIGKSSDYSRPSEIEQEFHFDGRAICAVFSENLVCGANITIATFWKTVFTIENSGYWTGRRYHFVQDYEPHFYPMGTEYLQAALAFERDFEKIAYGPWIPRMLLSKHGQTIKSVPFYIDKVNYRLRPKQRRDRRTILFFARPEMPRRCYELGIEALGRYVDEHGGRDEIFLFGSNNVDPAHVPFRCTNWGVLQREELAALYNRVTLGVAFSPTNPSMVPYEMMACGLPVLDLDVEGNAENYGSRSNVFLVAPDSALIVEKLVAILSDDEMRNRIAENGRRFVSQFPGEQEVFDRFARLIAADKTVTPRRSRPEHLS